MKNLAVSKDKIPAMSKPAIDKVKKLENVLLAFPQVELNTDHVIHGSMYARTVKIPKGAMLSGALIKVPTMLIINGSCRVFVGDDAIDVNGYNVLAASANRKQAFLSFEETTITMIFQTNVDSVEEAEVEFTNEYELLMSHKDSNQNTVIITEEKR
jgi:hypothetical protein